LFTNPFLWPDNQETRLRWLNEPPETRFRAKVKVTTSKPGYLSVAEDDLLTVLQQVSACALTRPPPAEHGLAIVPL
jgi:hypothetical protein